MISLKTIITNSFSGGTPSRDNPEYYDGEIPWIKSGELNSKFITKTSESISIEGLNNSSAKIVKPRTLLLALYGATAGIPSFTMIEAATNQAVLALEFKEGISKEYLYFYFLANRDNIIRKYCQGGQPNLSASLVKSLKISLPTYMEQQAVAKLLSTWDEAIELTQKLIDQLKLRKKGLMQQLLTGKKRLPGFEGDWEYERMGVLFEEIKDKNDGGNHEPLTISAKRGFVSQREKFAKVIAGSSLQKYIQLRQGDFSYNKGNSKTYPMGCIFLLDEFDSALVSFVYISFRPKQTIDRSFYKHWFANHGLDRQLKAIITSGARGDGLLNVSKSDFFQLKVPHPDYKEQQAISKVFDELDKEIWLQSSYLEQVELQKKGLMQQLLTGKTRVPLTEAS